MNYLADKSYLALRTQASPTVVEIPNVFAPLISESIRVNPNFTADRRLKGLSWKTDELLKGARFIEGDLTVWADPDILSHLFNMVYAKGVTTGSLADGYTHPFTVGEGKFYTLEIPRGDYAQRIWGARGENLKVSFQDNKMQAVLSIKALGQFYTAGLAVALTGAGMTSLVMKTNYDLRPTDGLVAGDKLVVGGVEITITSLNADGKTVNFGATTVTAAVGDPIYLKAQTPSFPALAEPLYLGNTLVGIAATSALAVTAAGAKATASPCYNLSFEFKNNLLSEPASGSTGPSVLLNQVREAAIELSRLFENPTQYQKWLEYVKQAITVITTGRFIKSDLTTSEKMTVNFHSVKLMTNEQPLESGQYIFDKQKFESLYDAGDGKAVEVTIINKTSGDDLGDDDSI